MGPHDIIRFPPPPVKLEARTWLLLGQAQAMIKALGALPMQPEDAYELHAASMAKGIHGTTAIEGNRLSEERVYWLSRGGAPLATEDYHHVRQIQNMVAAYDSVALDTIAAESCSFSIAVLNRYHQLVLDGLEADETVAGQLRSHSVTVGRYLAPRPDDCGILLEQFCEWLNQEEPVPEYFVSYDLVFDIVKAVSAHVFFALIHPYADGNGRMARLIEYALLLRAGIPASAAHAFSYCYSQTRERYYLELQDTHGDFVDGAYRRLELGKFVQYALDQVMEALERQLMWIGSAQTKDLWRQRIRSHFPVQLTVPQQRRLQLAQDLVEHGVGNSLYLPEIWDLLDDIPAGEFENSLNMMDRDLSALVKMGILTDDASGFQPNLDIMRSLIGNRGINRY